MDVDDKDKPDNKDKNFFEKFISYFKYDESLDRKINICLLYNAYYGVIFYRSRSSSWEPSLSTTSTSSPSNRTPSR